MGEPFSVEDEEATGRTCDFLATVAKSSPDLGRIRVAKLVKNMLHYDDVRIPIAYVRDYVQENKAGSQKTDRLEISTTERAPTTETWHTMTT